MIIKVLYLTKGVILSYEHPYLNPYSNFPGAADQAASLAAREASWTLGNDYVNGQLFEAQRLNSQFAQQEAAQRLQAEAFYVRDQHMRRSSYSQPTAAYVPTQPAVTKANPASSKVVQTKPKSTAVRKPQTDKDKVAAFLASNYSGKIAKSAKNDYWKTYFENGGFDITIYALAFLMATTLIATALYFFTNH